MVDFKTEKIKRTRTTNVILHLFKCIPLALRRLMFKGLFLVFYHFSPRQRIIALQNLQRAFPEKSIWELKRITRGVYRSIALTAADFFELPYINSGNLHEWVEIEGLENLLRAYEKKKGVLSILAHFGNWELMAIAVPLASKPLGIIYRPLDSHVLENIIAWVRTMYGNVLIPKEGATKTVRRYLRENWAIAILNDQNVAAREGIFVNFFGQPACTSPGVAYLALRTGAPVIPAFLARMENGKYKFIIEPEVEIIYTGDFNRDVIENTQKFANIVERMVRIYPEQWFWLHQRWKTKLHQAEKEQV